MATRSTRRAFRPPDEVFARLDKDPCAPLYLFHGDEAYLINRAVEHVRKRLGPEAEVRTFYAGDDALDALLETWGTASLFATQSLIVLKAAGQLPAEDRERLTAEAELRDESQPLVVCVQGRAHLTQKFFSTCAKRGFVAEFRTPFINQVPGWAQRLARERGVRLTAGAASCLADQIGPDLLALATELDKLAAFVFPSTDVDRATVVECAGDLRQHTAFELADALGQRDARQALRLLQQVVSDDKRAPIPVLHALVGHFRRLWQVKELSATRPERGNQAEPRKKDPIEQTLGLRGNRAQALVTQSRAFSYRDLHRILQHAAQLDLAFKSSPTSPRFLFDAFILDVCARTA